ncbi:glycosyltransferase [Candidatus Pelagibacter sp.]|nr:glycosyltransferase [Candidatus Pelagibacter sp.]
MKILYISQSVIPSKSANSIHAMKMCSALSKLRNEVHLFCWNNHYEIEKNIKNFFEFYDVQKSFKILRLKIFKFWILREMMTLIYLIYKILTNKYDLIYSRSVQLSWCLSLMGIKTILEIHSPPSNKTSFFFKSILKKGDLKFLILINNALKKYISENYEIHKYLELIVMPDAADLKDFHEFKGKSKFDNIIKNNSIGYLGHLYQGRGIEIIIKLAKEFPRNNFYIVGGAEHHVDTWKNKLYDLKNIFFLGFQNQTTCSYLRYSFDFLIAPYQDKVYVHGAISEDKKKKSKLETSKWMSPLKLFEYMEAKKPIITSNLPAVKEILTNNVDAILCNPKKFDEWKNAVSKLNKNRKLQKEISKNAYIKLKRNFTWNLRAKNLIFHFDRLLKKKNITIFNFSLIGGGTEYMLSVLFNKLIEFKDHNINMVTCQNSGHYVEKINDKNKLFSLEKKRVIFSILSLTNFLKKNNINIIFTSMTHTNVVAILIKFFFIRKLKVIIRESNTISIKLNQTKNFKSIILNFLVKNIYNSADIIIAPTKVIKDDLIANYGTREDKIKIIPNPYDFKNILFKSKENVNKNEKILLRQPFILSVGRLNPQKNYELLFKIFNDIVKYKKFTNIKLYILGEGRDKKKLKNLINKMGLKKSIYLLGFKKNPYKYMKKCKLFILSSKYEGHSNVLVHSQILNNKILASNAYGANKEILRNNGEIFVNNDPSDIAKQAIRIISLKKRPNDIKDLNNRFSEEKIVSRFSEIF